MHDFEELRRNRKDEHCHMLIAAINTIIDARRKKKPNHTTFEDYEEKRQLLEKRHLNRTTYSRLEMTLLNRLRRERAAKEH
ncbi:hypothetical protein ANCDUO_13275 [Ancylostoma duodenale]|uniref:Uncharacterized protein n=1 Tax=Ancylostoma duodenale TaxID=51022 RepID=A0A0C2G6D2_9BILA|nr:hypothetical protein ANCDUO_13275 [Ancylostoma duodenale]